MTKVKTSMDIEKETWKWLMKYKIDRDFSNLGDAIEDLIADHRTVEMLQEDIIADHISEEQIEIRKERAENLFAEGDDPK